MLCRDLHVDWNARENDEGKITSEPALKTLQVSNDQLVFPCQLSKVLPARLMRQVTARS